MTASETRIVLIGSAIAQSRGQAWWTPVSCPVLVALAGTPVALLLGARLATGTTSPRAVLACLRRTVVCAAFAAATLYLTLGGLVAFAWSGSPWMVLVFLVGVAGWPIAYRGFQRHREVTALVAYAVVVGVGYVVIAVAA